MGDYIIIPNGEPAEDNVATNSITVGTSRFCGRRLNPEPGKSAEVSVCSQLTPFKLTFVTDANEVTRGTDATSNEAFGTVSFNATHRTITSLGTIGFRLRYKQQEC